MKNTLQFAVIVTDCVDVSFVEMHQSLLNQLDKYGITDVRISPMVPVKNFSVINAAFNIRLLADIFPPSKTIFIVVVHGIQSSPARIFGQTKHGLIFVGNNSGYFNWLIEDFGLASLYENKINRTIDGRSFGGKYVQIPTAAKIIANVSFEELGLERSSEFLGTYSIPVGSVIHIDNFGLMKIRTAKLTEFNEEEKLQIYINGVPKIVANYTEKMKNQPDGEWVLFNGSSLYGLPELGRVRSQHSAQELNVIEGDIITWSKLV
jgi:S-adenosylmethionine hydrolase